MIDWEKRRAEYKAGKFKRKIVKRELVDLRMDHLWLECGHEKETFHDLNLDGDRINCQECAEAEE